jgi:hypothetical protein
MLDRMKSNAFTSDAESPCASAQVREAERSALSPAGLILLGTVHSDPKGFSRTRAFLQRHRPDLIMVEISPYALKFRKERAPELRKIFLERLRIVSRNLKIDYGVALKHVQIVSILRQTGIPYEYRAAAAYAKRTGIDLLAVDSSEFSRGWIETWPEMVSAANIELLLKLESAAPSASSLYAQAARRIGGGPSCPETLPAGGEPGWQEREIYLAAQITSALERFNPERPIYIGGWWHLSRRGNVKTVRELLGLGAASCLLLDRGAAGILHG